MYLIVLMAVVVAFRWLLRLVLLVVIHLRLLVVVILVGVASSW